MATIRKKLTLNEWQPAGEPVEMQNGTMAQRWIQQSTGLSRIVPEGLHPEDQPNSLAPVANDYQEDDPIEETATDRVATMLAVAGESERAELKVYRVNQGQLEYCRGFRPDEFEEGNFDMLRDRFGPGVYELRLYATHPENRKFVVRSKTRVTIADDKSASRPTGMDNGMAQVLQTIAQGQQQMLQALVEIKQAPQKDSMEEMGRMLTMMSAMRDAMGLNQPQRNEKSSIGEIVAAVRELRGVAEEIAPPEREDSLMGILPKMLDIVSKTQETQQAAQGFTPVQIPPSFDHPQPTEQPETTQESADMNLLAMVKLKGYLKTLCDMAKSKKPVSEGADFVYEKLPDDLIELMGLDNWFELLSSVAPEVNNCKEWLIEVRNAALKLFDEPESAN